MGRPLLPRRPSPLLAVRQVLRPSGHDLGLPPAGLSGPLALRRPVGRLAPSVGQGRDDTVPSTSPPARRRQSRRKVAGRPAFGAARLVLGRVGPAAPRHGLAPPAADAGRVATFDLPLGGGEGPATRPSRRRDGGDDAGVPHPRKGVRRATAFAVGPPPRVGRPALLQRVTPVAP